MKARDLRAQGERDLAERLLREPEIRAAIEQVEKRAEEGGARRHLLATATRLTAEMAPDVLAIADACRRTLEVEAPIEAYVYPQPYFNAAAVRPERGRLFVLFSSSLLEAFQADELRFVVGHEIGHHLFEHHRIPVSALLGGSGRLAASLVLELFAWQRYAEISTDRAGLACAGGLEPAARALFKLASGLSGSRVQVRIDQFLAQASELREEADRLAKSDETARADWFATHPFSPLRLKAAELFSESELLRPGGIAVGDLEARVAELMTLMEPSYLQGRTSVDEAMRRLLFAGGVMIAAAAGEISEDSLHALERLLGPGSIPYELKVDAIQESLPQRIASVKDQVPLLRRAQVVRDLCVIARADGRLAEAERRVLREIAEAVGVGPELVDCSSPPAAAQQG